MQASIVVRNQTPLCFRHSRSDKSVQTLHYIPGTALLGGLATAHNRLKQNKDEFAKFFTSEEIYFGNLYPASFEADELKGHDQPVQPIPMTARSCKRFPGFKFYAKIDDEERHGVSDHLIWWSLFALSNQLKTQVLEDHADCSFMIDHAPCHQPLTPYPGFYRRVSDGSAIARSEISRGVITKTGISRSRGSVQEAILYNREVLLEDQTFWGKIQCEDVLWKDFQEFLEEASSKGLIRLGNNRTRGLGDVSLKYLQVIESEESETTIKQRVESFTKSLKETGKKFQIELSHDLYIPVTLQSEVILRNEQGQYRTALDDVYITDNFGLTGLKRVYYCSSIRRVMGWNAFLGLPKADAIAIHMGSVFLFGLEREQDKMFWQKLFVIESKGIGERRIEGFGRVAIADPFHMEVKPL